MSCSKCSKCGEIGRPWCQWRCGKPVVPVKESKTPTKVVVSDDAEECPICYDELGDRGICVTKCGHKFCMDCVTKHLANSTACPMCRTPIIEKAIREPATSESDRERIADLQRQVQHYKAIVLRCMRVG